MHASIFRTAIIASAFAILLSSARAATYTATLLHPDDFIDSSAVGVSNTGQVGYGYSIDDPGPAHAQLWTGTAADRIDLHPSYLYNSYAIAATTTNQVGYGSGTTTGFSLHALLWSGTAASVVDLNPPDLTTSYAHGVSGSHQVGYGFNSSDPNGHALLWSGTAASKVDLHPTSGYTESFASGVSGNTQVGYGYGPATGDSSHALLWTGTAATKVDLNPAGYTESYANGVSGTKQVGSGSTTGSATHALLWSGTAASKVDLNPTGFDFSEAIGISAAGQVGDGFGPSTSSAYHALYWNSTAASVVDLHPSLDPLLHDFISSTAFGIADNGNIVGTATDDGGHTYAILWTPGPDVPSESGVAGDYNNDGKVNAADYIAWRKGINPLHNEVATIGSNSPADYTEWRTRFGNGAPGSGTELAGTSIPEPDMMTLFAMCFVLTAAIRPRMTQLNRKK